MKKLYIAIVALLFISTLSAQEEINILRTPALNFTGDQIAFSYQGDIWTVPVQGGVARRLTIHESYESHPQWSPDSDQLLFIGNRFSNEDIFIMDAEGSLPRRLTFNSSGDEEAKWGKNGQIYFTTKRVYAQVEREREIYTLHQSGGTPVRTLNALGFMPTPSPNGRYIAFVRGSCRIARESYTGPANRQLWLYDTQKKTYQQITTSDAQDVYPEWGSDEQLYFLSARNGRYNIYRLNMEGGKASDQPEALTNFEDEGIRYFDLSGNGKEIIFEKGTDFFTMAASPKAQPKKVEIEITRDYRFDPTEEKTFSNDIGQYAVSPNGKYVALSVHGELFITPEDKEKKRSARLTENSSRDNSPRWINDSTLLFLSDRGGNMDLYSLRSSDSEEMDLYKTFKLDIKAVLQTPDDEAGFVLSPDHSKVAILKGRGALSVYDISETGELSNEVELLNGWDTPSGLSWSPDSRWLAYALDDLDFNSEIYIHAADGSKEPVNISLHPRSDSRPVWSQDGSKLGFLSNRNYGDADVWFVWLKKSDWEKTQRDWEWEEDEEEPKIKDKKEEDKDSTKVSTVEPIQIDFEDIYVRLEQVTRFPGNESDLAISKDGETFYFSINNGGRNSASGKPVFMSIKWDGKDSKTLLEDKSVSNLQWDKNHKNIYLLVNGGRLAKLPAMKGKLENLPFSAKMTIDHMAEREQVFDEAWRILRDGFYDPNFHGKDWASLKAKYRPRALAASTSQDFRMLFNEMLGQLNASHMGLYGSNPEETQKERTGQLGIELEPVAEGVEVTYVLPDGPADRTNSKLNVGDIITAVNGTPVTSSVNFYSLLSNLPGERTLLAIRGQDGESREVVIRPGGSVRSELYRAWVAERKQLTEKYSNGRLGYIHIQGMNWSSFERFERELTASGLGKEGMVIDVRFNGGGWTTDMLMTILNVRQHAYTIPRGAADNLEEEHPEFADHYPYGERLPFPALMKPSIALCNQNSYSNAEIFSHAYKHLGHGTLVGQPTFGAVISTGGRGLMDGSYVRLPYRAWYVKATGENMEHSPAVPDIIVENAPDSKAEGEDPQLKKAVQTLLEQIDEG